MSYTRPDGVPLDLSQVKYQGQSPIAWSNEIKSVSYLVTVSGSGTYTISQDSFRWPSLTNSYVYRYNGFGSGFNGSYNGYVATTYHSLSWTNFHNLDLSGIVYAESASIFPSLEPLQVIAFSTGCIRLQHCW